MHSDKKKKRFWEKFKKGTLGPLCVFAVDRDVVSDDDFLPGLVEKSSFFSPAESMQDFKKGVSKVLSEGVEFSTKNGPQLVFTVPIRDYRKRLMTGKIEDELEYHISRIDSGDLSVIRFDENHNYFAIYEESTKLPTQNLEKVAWFLNDYKNFLDYSRSPFAWGGDFYYLLKFEGQDARKHFFPVTFYGEEMVKEIGREKLLSAPVWKAGELGGGVLLQVQENPFYKVDKKDLEKVEDYLGLSGLEL